MPQTMLDPHIIHNAVELACRAPSLHNSQPWRWVADDEALHLFADPSRIGRHSDSTGREVVISCGAVLDHLCVAAGAAGWDPVITRFPNPTGRNHLATIEFRHAGRASDRQRALAAAIGRRRTDRIAEPQVLVRVGAAPRYDVPPPPTHRRALADVLEIRTEPVKSDPYP
jgi:nitroreductase